MATYKFSFRTISKESFVFLKYNLPDDIMKVINIFENHDMLCFGEGDKRTLINLDTVVGVDIEKVEEKK